MRVKSAVTVESFGRRNRTYSTGPDFELAVLERHAPGFLAPGPTELVRIRDAETPPRTYLVDAGLLRPKSDAPGAG